ncbi:MAG: sel1 repeat family protein, partial [Arenibacter algicola]|nr:sel1 repeat family protein [Arenibacter algicola]
IGIRDRKGTPLSPQFDQIFSWGEQILHGNPEAIYQFGIMLIENDTYPEDKILGCRWLFKAVSKNHAQARYRLARQLLLGNGVLQVPDLGYGYLDQAIRSDNVPEAFIFAADMAERGDLLQKDLMQAYAALLRARRLGGNVEARELKRLRTQLSETEIKVAQKYGEEEESLVHFSLTDEAKRLNEPVSASYLCRFKP